MALMLACILMALSGAGGASLSQSCITNRDCIEVNTYCYQSGRCVPCTDCSLYNRSPGAVCAKDKSQCGKCLPGMDTEFNLDGTFSCHPSGTVTPSTQTPGPDAPENSFTLTIIIAAVIGSLIGLCICTYIMYKCTNRCVIIRNIFSICPNNSLMNTGGGGCSKCPESFLPQQSPVSGPPPYTERNPTAPPCEDPPAALDPGPPICQRVYTPIENDPSQRANAYINPHYIRGGNHGTHPPELEEPEEDPEAAENDALINASSISQPDDEETQPSTWTPTTGSQTGSTTGLTSFANALSLQQLRISQPDVTTMQQGTSARSNSHPSFQFGTQNQPDQSENPSDGNGSPQQINVINVGPFYISPTVSSSQSKS